MDAVEAAISAIRDDTRSGSSRLLGRGVELLQRIAPNRAAMEEAARQLCRAQPSMAGFRTLAGLLRTAPDPRAALQRFARQIARAPAAIARNAIDRLRLRGGTGPLRVVTCSASQAVEAAIAAAAAQFEVVACCAEGRPGMEGRDLAARLAASGIPVEFYTDAAIGTTLGSAEALLVGADAVGPVSFINKVGTGALCTLAQWQNVPVYVLAGREKALEEGDFVEIEVSRGPGNEVWPDPPDGVSPGNPYFEVIPLSLVSALVSDTGVINMSV